ncbi:helix-turn-helix domain-containing protein [Mycolicibacterium iranicum]|uniref:helix-turn-helix domain-containing protein n=1 Tax=Mycolicibacterium iranicum TaxID=912594 RepID=UPI0009EE3D42|nr:helix-turn-helix transcriptional regulator [Mycolicibacterium iranicum]
MTTALEAGHIPPIRLEYRLLLARLEAGLTAQELADRMGCSRDVVSRAENGKSKPRKMVMNAWALATGVPVSWLRDGVGDMNPPDDPDAARPEGFEPPTS